MANTFLRTMQTILALMVMFFLAPAFTMVVSFMLAICHVITAEQAVAALGFVQDIHAAVLGFELFPIR